MAALARQGAENPDLRRLVSEFGSIDAWDSFVRRHFLYREEQREVVRTIPFMMETFQDFGMFEGDCDCISTFNAAATKAMGLPSRLVAIRTEADSLEFLHVYSEALAQGTWRRLDPTVPASVVDGEIDYGRILEYV